MDQLKPLLGPPVEPPDDVWANAIAGAMEDPRSPAELAALLPVDDAVHGTSDAPELDAADDDVAVDAPAPDDWSDHDWPGAESHQDHVGADDDFHRPDAPDTDPDAGLGL